MDAKHRTLPPDRIRGTVGALPSPAIPSPEEPAMPRRTASVVLCLALVLLAGCGGGKPSEDVQLGGLALTDVLDGLMTRTVRVLSSINGLEAADAAEPRLQEINDDFYDLRYHAPKLSETGQRELARHAGKQCMQVRAMVDTVMGMRPLADRLGGQMTTMMGHLEALMAPPYKEPDA
jgi:hypothetical protein